MGSLDTKCYKLSLIKVILEIGKVWMASDRKKENQKIKSNHCQKRNRLDKAK